jgi:protein phosphatase
MPDPIDLETQPEPQPEPPESPAADAHALPAQLPFQLSEESGEIPEAAHSLGSFDSPNAAQEASRNSPTLDELFASLAATPIDAIQDSAVQSPLDPQSSNLEASGPIETHPASAVSALAGPEDSNPHAPAPLPSNSALRLDLAVLSDIGCVRANNEDSFGYDQALGLYVVCDGMGGMASGEIASALAVSTLISTYAASANSGLPVSTRLLEAIAAANHAVWQFGQQPEHRGMGTTLVAAAVEGPSLIVGNVGDSRAYMLHDGQCIQLTVDHSYLNELIRNGTLTLENAHMADLNGMESVITRAIGATSDVQPDFFSILPAPGDQFLLASDGLTRYLNQDEILQILLQTELAKAPSTLIDIAKARGGVDNITCLLLHAN